MERRTFLQAAATGAVVVPAALADDKTPAGREIFELRSYSVRPGKLPLLENYFEKALIPALNRRGVKPVGVFLENAPSEKTQAHLLATYKSVADFTTTAAGLTDDGEYRAAAATDAVYERIESSLLRGIAGLPGLKAPALKPRLFNLRIYESHNEAAAQKKIEMFNTGELEIFRRVGLTPVMFGEALVGSRLPNLTYLLVFDDDTGRQDAWKRFGADPEWKRLKAIPEYEDKRIVSRITNKLLAPAAYSQI
jgi:hypothetical protein